MEHMELAADLLGTVLCLIQGYFFYCTVSCMLRPKTPPAVRLLNGFFLTLVSIVVIQPLDAVNITFTFLLFLADCLIFFEGRWYVKLSAVMMLYPVTAALNFLLYNVGTHLFFTFSAGHETLNTVLSNLSQIITLAFWYIFSRTMKERLAKAARLLNRKSWLLFDIICLASLAAVISFTMFTPVPESASWPAMLACIAANTGGICLASYLADTIQADMEQKNISILHDYYSELEQNQSRIRQICHDMKNHLAVLKELLIQGQTEEASRYLDRLTGYMETTVRRFCDDDTVNALLNIKYNQACAEGIDCVFRVDINSPQDSASIDPVSLCTIFANTLDNAIEACRKIELPEKRSIRVSARYAPNGYFSFEIRNSVQNKIRGKNGHFLTDKKDTFSHGIGISSVRSAVERYGGTIDISCTEDTFCVTVLIELPAAPL